MGHSVDISNMELPVDMKEEPMVRHSEATQNGNGNGSSSMHKTILGYGGSGLVGIISAAYIWGADIKAQVASMFLKQEKMVELQVQTNVKLDKQIDITTETNKKLDKLIEATYRRSR